MWDGGYKQGRLNGYSTPSAEHPLFQTRTVQRILTDDDDFQDVFGKKPPGGVSLQEAARRSTRTGVPDDWNKACYRTKGGSVCILPKAVRPDASLPAARLQPLVVPARPRSNQESPSMGLSRSSSAPGRSFRSRHTCISYDHWHTKHHTLELPTSPDSGKRSGAKIGPRDSRQEEAVKVVQPLKERFQSEAAKQRLKEMLSAARSQEIIQPEKRRSGTPSLQRLEE